MENTNQRRRTLKTNCKAIESRSKQSSYFDVPEYLLRSNRRVVVVVVVFHMGACASKQPATKTTSSHDVFLGNDFGEDEEDDVVKGGVRNDDVDAKGGGIAFGDADEIRRDRTGKREEEAFVLVRTKDATTHTVGLTALTTNFTHGRRRRRRRRRRKTITFTKREEEKRAFSRSNGRRKRIRGARFLRKKKKKKKKRKTRIGVVDIAGIWSDEKQRGVGKKCRRASSFGTTAARTGTRERRSNRRDERARRAEMEKSEGRSPNNNNGGQHDYHHDYHHQQQQQQQRNRQPHQNRTARRRNSFSWLSPHPSPRQTQATTPTGQYRECKSRHKT